MTTQDIVGPSGATEARKTPVEDLVDVESACLRVRGSQADDEGADSEQKSLPMSVEAAQDKGVEVPTVE